MNNKKKKNRKVLLPAEAGAVVGNDIYFFSSEYNLLYKIHMPEFTASIISHIPCEKKVAFKWFRKMRYWRGKLILIPSCAEKIWLYDLCSREWRSISIAHPQIPLKFWGTIIYQDTIFLFGAAYPAILKINLNDYSISYLELPGLPARKEDESGLFCTEAIRLGNMVYSPVSISNHVMWMNLDTSEFGWKQVGTAGNEYCGIDYDKSDFWIPSWQHGKIVKWDGDLQWEEFELPEEIVDRRYQFTGAVCDENTIRFLTIQDGKSLEIRKDISGKVWIALTEETKRYVHIEHYEDGTIVLMRSDAGMDVKWKGSWITGSANIAYRDFKEYFCEQSLWDTLSEKGIVNEAKIFDVDDYIDMMRERQKRMEHFLSEQNAGKHLWKVIR